MFTHNFKYALKTLFRNKALIFWTFAFPIILGTFFYMAFSNITSSEKLDIINIAIIDNDEFSNSQVYKTAFNQLSDKNSDDRLFEIEYTNTDKAKELLDDDKIVAYIELVNDTPKLVFKQNGINQTIVKYVTEEISQTNDMIKNIIEEEIKQEMDSGSYNIDYEKIYKKILEITDTSDIKINNTANNNLDYTVIEFYTLIAMTCLYGGMLGMTAINQNLANMSNKGKRVSVSPTKKSTIILSSVLVSYITQLIGLILLFMYTIFVLKIDFGNNIPLVILLACVGSFTGLSMGVFIGSVVKSGEGAKIGILLAVTMVGCYLSGMMGISMKYVVDKNIPIINKLNPASMITDGFYSLYYYSTLNRYWFNIFSLLIFAFVLIILSFIGLRRQKYDSI